MAEHTAGPWRHDGGPIVHVRFQGQNLQICKCFRRDTHCDDLSETEANARLIAAAPDLLAACKEALAAVDEAYQATGFVRIMATSEQRLRIEAAIRKAEER